MIDWTKVENVAARQEKNLADKAQRFFSTEQQSLVVEFVSASLGNDNAKLAALRNYLKKLDDWKKSPDFVRNQKRPTKT